MMSLVVYTTGRFVTSYVRCLQGLSENYLSSGLFLFLGADSVSWGSSARICVVRNWSSSGICHRRNFMCLVMSKFFYSLCSLGFQRPTLYFSPRHSTWTVRSCETCADFFFVKKTHETFLIASQPVPSLSDNHKGPRARIVEFNINFLQNLRSGS
jgi:hypothetical protein